MPAPELGTKQICPTCQAKFYDLTRRPAHCPKCGSDFDPDEAVRSRRVRARSTPADYEAEEAEDKVVAKESEDEEAEEEATPEIDAAVEAEPLETDDETDDAAAPAETADDLGVDFEEEEEAAEADDEAVPFLEEDEDIEDEIVVDPDADET